MSDNENIINEILDLEFEMFVNVRSKYPVSCQQNPKAFRLHRGSQFSVWSEDTLLSYREDLVKAAEEGKNLMTLKYARMENLIPPLNESPIINEIANLEFACQKEMSEKYPKIIGRARPLKEDVNGATSFLTYLKGELETYSQNTLELLLRDITTLKEQGKNWTEMIYAKLVQKMGYKSLQEAEDSVNKS